MRHIPTDSLPTSAAGVLPLGPPTCTNSRLNSAFFNGLKLTGKWKAAILSFCVKFGFTGVLGSVGVSAGSGNPVAPARNENDAKPITPARVLPVL